MADLPFAPRMRRAGTTQNRHASLHVDRGADREMVGRLREAVRAAGGNKVVAHRSGVPLATVNNYVRGRNGMKIEPLSVLAAACNVSLEWLVSGTEASAARSPSGGELPAVAAVPPPGLGETQSPSPLAGISGGIDVRVLAKAIEIVAAVVGPAGFRQDPKALARRIAHTYAVLIEPDASPV